ncbi:DUF1822 family protein (plasmid) [Nostoc sp. UHCC 0926]|uniref:DUF1822 family protein n=1 Tax=Nostoc sp. UHCC 0926 TaxID=3025190 RepID=UPI00235F1C25|nr:DUF1822 family protein [Nostoc sp. UHCC 0926]WDD36974.1 DUF1822 family protein [Nostoc sp. UHCC 0926]
MTTLCTVTGSISPVLRRHAEKCSKLQATFEKSRQVLLNMLSVSFVKSYLEYLGFETDLEGSDSWNPVWQTLMDVADLSLKTLGKLECRPVLENSQFVYVPPEVQSDRICYVAVQISDSLREAKLLGFFQESSTSYLPINQLQSIEELLKYLELCELKDRTLKSLTTDTKNSNSLLDLKKWFENIFLSGWQTVESLLVLEPAWQIRSYEEKSINILPEQAKLIDFGIQAQNTSVVIVVRLRQSENNKEERLICIELHAANGQDYLPNLLHVILLDEQGNSVIEAKAKNNNKKIELQFIGVSKDKFGIKIILGDISLVENFVI